MSSKRNVIEVKPGDPFYYEDYFEYGGFVKDGGLEPNVIANQLIGVGEGGHLLSHLLDICNNTSLDKESELQVRNEIIKLNRSGVVTDQECEILLSAWAGDIKSALYLVIAYPESLNLPFVRKALIKGMREMRYSTDYGQVTNLKELFSCLIPDRHSGDIPFSNIVLTEAEESIPLGTGILDRRERLAKALNVSEKTIRKRTLKGKGTRGRPIK
jgi:hypothetical protein